MLAGSFTLFETELQDLGVESPEVTRRFLSARRVKSLIRDTFSSFMITSACELSASSVIFGVFVGNRA